ncbi:glycosyltransferase [Leuconostoc litchii]|uniref:Glycosyltransferase n=1 Tax=Leuconostoc litchii TaxID=1981069 RepID=A0A6P2CK13_9LACO|nr:glycosyltransferase [Leuconostoc litchii]TYC46208.1 glycosyltransferase [Leuconostoc litchii]GMA70332.1 glycosyltransferase [Leuconostoc litchii]
MEAIFLNTYYAKALSGASYAVNKRMELFQQHNINTTVITTNYFITNRYYLAHHFPNQIINFLDLTDILADNIFVNEQNALKKFIMQKEKQYTIDFENRRGISPNQSYFVWRLYPDGRLLSVTYYNKNHNPIRTDSYDWRGYLSTFSYFSYDSVKNKLYVARREHFSSNGIKKIIYHFQSSNNIRRIDWIRDNNEVQVFNNVNDLMLEGLIYYTSNNKHYLIISDLFNTNTIAKISRLNQRPNTKLLIQLHNIQVNSTLDHQPVRIGYSYPILNQERYSGIIALTARQKQDIDLFRRKEKSNVYTIPENWFSKQDIEQYHKINWEDKEDGLVIVSARLDQTKQVDHAIKAIIFARQSIPSIHLEIWGQGAEKTKLQALIDKENAQEFVKLKGFTDNEKMKKRMSDAKLHLLTSVHEGLPMVLFEAQIGKTPSICYDIDYGPDDIIENRVNGELITANDVKYLSIRIVELFKNKEDTLQKYSVNSQHAIKKYSDRNVWHLWEKLLEKIY